MRILVVSAFFETHRGGIEIVAGALARQFRRARHAVTWMAAGCDPVPSDGLSGRCVPLPVYNGTERLLGFPLPIPGLNALSVIHHEVAAADAILIHDALYPANIAAFLFARWLDKPVVLTQHIGAVPYANPVLRILMRVMNRVVARPMLAAVEQAVFVSRLTADKFKDVAFRRPSHVIFSGVDVQIFRAAHDAQERQAIRERFDLAADRPVALFVGRFVEKKGLHILRAAAQASPDIDWVLAGWGGIDPNAWRLPNVRVVAGADQASLAPLYRASDVFVLPSVGEGFPLVLQEAAVSGLPMVCGADTASADGRLAPMLYPVPIEGRAAADAATDVVMAVRRALAEHAAAYAGLRAALVSGWYSWEESASRYLDLFSELLKAKDAGMKPVGKTFSAAGADR
jgi:glycosyltransferase involved in cell wall biosynthesis